MSKRHARARDILRLKADIIVPALGTVEELLGKFVGNKELHDKGVARKVRRARCAADRILTITAEPVNVSLI